MSYMLLEIFLLMLAAYLAGAMLACFLRRTFFAKTLPATAGGPDWRSAPVAGATAAGTTLTLRTLIDTSQPRIELAPRPEPMPEPPRPDLQRFERALRTGAAIDDLPRVPVVEIRPQVLKTATGPAAPIAKPQEKPAPFAPAVPAPAPAAKAPEPAPQPTTAPVAAPAQPVPAKTEYAPVAAAGMASAAAAALAAQAQQRAAAATAAPPAAPPPAAAPQPATERLLSPDDLTRVRAIDTAIQKRLNDAGITRFDQIARWSGDDVARVSQSLGFTGRIEQENWIEQAQILAKGGETNYSRRQALGVASQAAAASAPPSEPVPSPTQRAEPMLPADAAVGAAAAAALASVAATRQATPPARDRLQRITGINADVEALLNLHGVTHYSHIASWTPGDVEKFDKLLGRSGRIGEERWAEQARVLDRGGDLEPKPTRLADAIKENQAKAPAVAQAETTAPAQAGPAEAPARPEMQTLRSVRSAALGGPVTGAMDDLKRIRGIGVLIEKKLNSLGVSSYEQIANWTGADIDRISQILDFKGRIERENWVEQSRILASGGQTEFSRRVDRGDPETSRDPNRF